MFFRMRPFVCCSQSIRAFLHGEVTGSYSGVIALVYRAREQGTLEPYERIHQILD